MTIFSIKLYNINFNALRILFLFTILCFSTQPLCAQNEETGETTVKEGVERFSLIYERNIFDPNRRKIEPIEPPVQVETKTPQIDEISLVGTLVTDASSYAFFNGTSAAYRGVVLQGDQIAGCIITAIHPSHVILNTPQRSIQFNVGMILRRVDDGEWNVTSGTSISSSYSSESSSGDQSRTMTTQNTSDSTADGTDSDMDDILKKMMERRRQEMEK